MRKNIERVLTALNEIARIDPNYIYKKVGRGKNMIIDFQ
jgi:chaperonin cofactor prefoldin